MAPWVERLFRRRAQPCPSKPSAVCGSRGCSGDRGEVTRCDVHKAGSASSSATDVLAARRRGRHALVLGGQLGEIESLHGVGAGRGRFTQTAQSFGQTVFTIKFESDAPCWRVHTTPEWQRAEWQKLAEDQATETPKLFLRGGCFHCENPDFPPQEVSSQLK
eukprot:6630783-Prymnesium_polylepis.1